MSVAYLLNFGKHLKIILRRPVIYVLFSGPEKCPFLSENHDFLSFQTTSARGYFFGQN